MQFQLKHLLIAFIGIALLLAVATIFLSPLFRFSEELNAAQRRIKRDLDHAAILESSNFLLLIGASQFIDNAELPDAIAQTQPKSVYVNNGVVHIEYGGGFGHYGLIVDPNNKHRANPVTQAEGVYRQEQLIQNVYYYETE